MGVEEAEEREGERIVRTSLRQKGFAKVVHTLRETSSYEYREPVRLEERNFVGDERMLSQD